MRLVTAREMQEIDRLTIDGGLVPALTLMERAGRAVAASALAMVRQSGEGGHVVVLCGKGNNGGDGLVAARVLAEHGVHVRVGLFSAAEQMSEDAHANLPKLAATSVIVGMIPDPLPEPGDQESSFIASIEAWREEMRSATLCIDALLGTGVTSTVQGRMAACIDWLSRTSRRTLAVDVPSGIDANTGAVCGTAVWADHTVTMGNPKLGLVLFPGRERTGNLEVADLGFPASVLEAVTRSHRREWVDGDLARSLLPRLDPQAHKYARGVVVAIVGSRDYPGAAALVATAALRAGAGMVHVVAPESIRSLLQTKLTEAIVHGAPETREGRLAAGFEPIVASLASRVRALVVGPGLGDAPETISAVSAFLRTTHLPAVVDAEAIAALPQGRHPGPRIVTPHAGELARWMNAPAVESALDRFELASAAARQHGVVVLAKGAPTAVVTPDGTWFVNSTGHAGLATAGSGDVLAGIVGALLAQGCDATAAATLGSYLHGRSAEIATGSGSQRSLVAGDLPAAIGHAYASFEPASNGRAAMPKRL